MYIRIYIFELGKDLTSSFVHAQICMPVYLCICTCACTYIFMCDCVIYMYMIFVCAFGYTCICVSVSVYLYICAPVHLCICICVYVYKYWSQRLLYGYAPGYDTARILGRGPAHHQTSSCLEHTTIARLLLLPWYTIPNTTVC
jgi:hypothetical protein